MEAAHARAGVRRRRRFLKPDPQRSQRHKLLLQEQDRGGNSLSAMWQRHFADRLKCRTSSPLGTVLLSFKDDNNVDSRFEKQRSIIAWIAGVAAS